MTSYSRLYVPRDAWRALTIALAVSACACVAEVDDAEDAAGDVEGTVGELVNDTYNFGTLAAPGKCMDVSGASTADRAQIQQWQCNGSGAQSFRVENLDGGVARLINTHSNKCVDIDGAGKADGTKVQLWSCNGGSAQRFRIEDVGGGNVRLVNPNSNKCLDVAGSGSADGTKIQLWTCNGTKAQTFRPASIGVPPPPPPPPPAGGGACKRGIATNVAPGSAFAGSIAWWYNWGHAPFSAQNHAEFVPMFWDERDANRVVNPGARFLLGFNEPNFKVQADLTPTQAANAWRTLEAQARAAGVPTVSPAVNFCGPAQDCNGTNPYQYLREFFAACQGCKVDYVAVHWYNCDLASLKDFLEPGGGLEGFEQFGRPIWLTEFACAIGGDTSAAAQEAYMRAAIPYLESNPHVFRYSWFSADPIPQARLVNGDGSPTALGRVYMSLPRNCQ
jgi:hypothetical protein